FVIGDKYVDVETAHNVGAKGILVLTGFGEKEIEKHPGSAQQPDLVVQNLMEAVDSILSGVLASTAFGQLSNASKAKESLSLAILLPTCSCTARFPEFLGRRRCSFWTIGRRRSFPAVAPTQFTIFGRSGRSRFRSASWAMTPKDKNFSNIFPSLELNSAAYA